MDKNYKEFLIDQESITSKYSGVNSRVSKARTIEKQFGIDLDSIVIDDFLTYSLLKILSLNDHHGNKQNAVRKYYEHKNGKKFPQLAEFEGRFSKLG